MVELSVADLVTILLGVITLGYMIAKDIFSNKK